MDYVQIGYVDSKQKKLVSKPWESKLGGAPSFYEEGRVCKEACAACGYPLFLVAQVYAPTDKERSLIILGCNSEQCNRLDRGKAGHGTWVALRTQGGAVAEETEGKSDEGALAAARGAAAAAEAAAREKEAPVDLWGAGGGWGSEGSSGDAQAATAAGGWGDVGAAAAEDTLGGWGALASPEEAAAAIASPAPAPAPAAAPAHTPAESKKEKKAKSKASALQEAVAGEAHSSSAALPAFPCFPLTTSEEALESCDFPASSAGGKSRRADAEAEVSEDGGSSDEDMLGGGGGRKVTTISSATSSSSSSSSAATKGLAAMTLSSPSSSASSGAGGAAAASRASGKDDRHTLALLERYRHWEESEGAAASSTDAPALSAGAAAAGAIEDADAGSEEEEEEEEGGAAAGAAFPKPDKKGGSKKSSRSKHGGGGGGGTGEERYERVPAATRALLRFQNRVAEFPEQCVRYAYGTLPVLPVPVLPESAAGSGAGKVSKKKKSKDAAAVAAGADREGGSSGLRELQTYSTELTKGSKGFWKLQVPPCPCGAARVFELQVMPAALQHLQVDAFTAEKVCGGKAARAAAAHPSASHSTVSAGDSAAASAVATSTAVSLSSPALATAAVGGAGNAAGKASTHAPSSLSLPSGMDFLTVLVYSCEASCEDSDREFVQIIADSGDKLKL